MHDSVRTLCVNLLHGLSIPGGEMLDDDENNPVQTCTDLVGQFRRDKLSSNIRQCGKILWRTKLVIFQSPHRLEDTKYYWTICTCNSHPHPSNMCFFAFAFHYIRSEAEGIWGEIKVAVNGASLSRSQNAAIGREWNDDRNDQIMTS